MVIDCFEMSVEECECHFRVFCVFSRTFRWPGKFDEVSASSPSVKILFLVLTPQKLRFSFFVFDFEMYLIRAFYLYLNLLVIRIF